MRVGVFASIYCYYYYRHATITNYEWKYLKNHIFETNHRRDNNRYNKIDFVDIFISSKYVQSEVLLQQALILETQILHIKLN